VAFDGASIWVANFLDNTVNKLRATDELKLGAFAVGTGPRGIAFDGTNIWVANPSSNNVTELRTTDESTLNFSVGNGPVAIACDGTNIWVANYLSDSGLVGDSRS